MLNSVIGLGRVHYFNISKFMESEKNIFCIEGEGKCAWSLDTGFIDDGSRFYVTDIQKQSKKLGFSAECWGYDEDRELSENFVVQEGHVLTYLYDIPPARWEDYKLMPGGQIHFDLPSIEDCAYRMYIDHWLKDKGLKRKDLSGIKGEKPLMYDRFISELFVRSEYMKQILSPDFFNQYSVLTQKKNSSRSTRKRGNL